MKLIIKLSCLLLALLPTISANAQNSSDDVFVPLSKYITRGDVESLSAWFDNNLEISVLTQGGMASKAQAKQIMKTFFAEHKPESFEVNHTAGKANMKYILARLKTEGELYHVVLFLNSRRGTYRIQQIKIDRIG